MRKLLAILALIVLSALTATATVTVVQTKSQLTRSFSGSGISLTFTSGTTAGNGVVVLAGGHSTGADPVTGVSDTHSDTCTQEAEVFVSARSFFDIYYCQSVTAGTTQFTVSTSSSQQMDMWIVEVSGAGAFDAKGTSTTSFAQYSAPSVTTTAANDFLIGGTAGAEGTGTTLSAGSGWTSLGGDTAMADIAEYEIAGSTGSYSLQLTATTSGDYFSSAIVALKPSGGSGLALCVGTQIVFRNAVCR